MFAYIWPIALAVLSNMVYHICAKSVPSTINPLASVTITYAVATVASLILFLTLNKGDSLFKEYSQLNWAPFVLGIAIIGLEVGFLYAYKNGWSVNSAAIVQAAFLAVGLLFIGYFLFREPITANKAIGMIVCLAGLYIINK